MTTNNGSTARSSSLGGLGALYIYVRIIPPLYCAALDLPFLLSEFSTLQASPFLYQIRVECTRGGAYPVIISCMQDIYDLSQITGISSRCPIICCKLLTLFQLLSVREGVYVWILETRRINDSDSPSLSKCLSTPDKAANSMSTYSASM